MHIYAGVGARITPPTVQNAMMKIARALGEEGYLLRSGGAAGADRAFEAGAGKHPKEIFLATHCTAQAKELASKFHPAWNNCPEFARKLHGRNMMILLGKNLDSPVELVICWTPNGAITGGTGQALRAAKHYNIPVRNLYYEHL